MNLASNAVHAFILSALATVIIGVLAVLHDPIPDVLTVIAGGSAIGGAALSTPIGRR